jgi:ABC-type glycerol-3-phosphate transport system substrate-binding protein
MKRGLYMLIGLAVILTFVLGACGGGTSSSGVKIDEKSPITVWIDAARVPAKDAYLATHPDKANLVNFELVDRATLSAKVLLFNNTGSGWPDVVFAEPNLVMNVADAAHNFPMDLTPYVDKKIIDAFVPGSLDPCYTSDKKLLCLRNDLAPLILWYNKPLMDQFGYTIPTTWEEFQALSDKLAAEHPGYVMGSAGNIGVHFLWPSGCPIANQISVGKVQININDPKCLRAVNLVQHMLDNGTLSKYDQFDPKYIEIANNNKILMQEDAAWMGDYVFGGKPDSAYYKTADHQLAAALPLKWADETKIITGAWGGSAWTVSRHTKNPRLAVDVAIYMTTDIPVGKLVGTMPAYGPSVDEWQKGMDTNPLYAMNPYKIMVEATGYVKNAGFTDAVRYDINEGLKPLTTAILNGTPLLDSLADCQTALKKLAEDQGYEVVTTP